MACMRVRKIEKVEIGDEEDNLLGEPVEPVSTDNSSTGVPLQEYSVFVYSILLVVTPYQKIATSEIQSAANLIISKAQL